MGQAVRNAGRARGLGRGFRGRAPRNFSPLGQASRKAPPVGRPSVKGSVTDTRSIVGSAPNRLSAPRRTSGSFSGRLPGAGKAAAAGGGLMGTAGLAVELGLTGIDIGARALNSDFDNKRSIADTYAAKYGPAYGLTPKEMAAELAKTGDIDPLSMRQLYGGSSDMDAGPGGPSTLSVKTAPATLNGIAGIVDVDPKTGKGLPGTFRRGDMDAGDAATYTPGDGYTFDSDRFTATPPASPTRQDLPASAEQVAPVDPYAYQLSVYGQGRQAADSQEAQKKVADLGLAINKAMYPQFSNESYNPLMAATFPERYQKTPENFVVQNGIQSPRSMINGDNSEALAAAREEQDIYRMDVALDDVLENVLNQARLRQQGQQR